MRCSSASRSDSDVISRRRFIAGAAGGLLVVGPRRLRAQEGLFLDADAAPRHLFRGATAVTLRTAGATPALRERIRDALGQPPSVWETAYPIYTVKRDGTALGFVVVVEEIGKHRPITFAVAVEPNGRVHDLAVLAYREAYGGEVRERRFLRQYAGKSLGDPLLPYRDITNISGATLSVQATGRAARKAIAVLRAEGLV